jgi:hypothetical protein
MILSYQKKYRAKVQTSGAGAVVAIAVPVPQHNWVTIDTQISVAKSDNAQRGTYRDVSGFYRQTGNVTKEGSTASLYNIESAGGLTVAHVANTTDQTVEIQVTGIAAEDYVWDVQVTARYQENLPAYSGPPRLEMTISGMAAAGKVDWQGLTDGIGQVLVPDLYNLSTTGSSRLELWRLGSPIGGDDLLWMLAQQYGSPTPYYLSSKVRLSWKTYTGSGGSGTSTVYNWLSTWSGTQTPSINGKLRDGRTCSNSHIFVTAGGNVTFTWQRKAGDPFANY